MLTEVEKAYLAGVIDSDGCIYMERWAGRGPNYSYTSGTFGGKRRILSET